MIPSNLRKKIARDFLGYFCKGITSDGRYYGELQKNYKSECFLTKEYKEPRAWMPIPCPYITDNKHPFIGVAETFKEAWEIAEIETEKDSIRMEMCEFEEYDYKGNKVWVVYD